MHVALRDGFVIMMVQMLARYDQKNLAKILLLELFLTSHSARVREIAIECKKDVLDLGIHRMVKALKRIGTRGNLAERSIHLCHIFEIDSYVPLRQLWWP